MYKFTKKSSNDDMQSQIKYHSSLEQHSRSSQCMDALILQTPYTWWDAHSQLLIVELHLIINQTPFMR